MQSKIGLLCVLLGSDGSGKGTVVNNILSDSTNLIDNTINLHWRPGFLPPLRKLINPRHDIREDIVDPQSERHKNQSQILSLARWAYYLLDYIVGYFIKILPLKRKGTIILFDRYYYDYFVDPVRYGFNLPLRLYKLALLLIPKPDMTIYLDNIPEELYKRKQELPLSELERQVNEWRKLIPSLPNARIVTTDKPVNDVVSEVVRLVLERRTEMERKLWKIETEASQYLWKSEITDYIALPSRKNCRWIIPTNPKLAKKAWDLYQPYSIKGKLYKNYQKYMGRISPFILKKTISFDSLNSDKSQILKKKIFDILGTDDIVMAISTGTPSPFRKVTGFVMSSDGTPRAYIKIGETPLAIGRIKNEAKMLKVIGDRSWVIGRENIGVGSEVRGYRGKDFGVRIKFPELLYEGEIGNGYILIQSPAPFKGKSGDKYFNDDNRNILKTLINNTSITKKFNESDFYIRLKEAIDSYSLSYRDVLQTGLNHLEKTLGDKEITFSLSHGDFAPWNMIWKEKEVFIYDWESACKESPAGIDLIHFLFQTGFLLKKYRGNQLFYFCINQKLYQMLSNEIDNPLLDSKLLFLSYLLELAISEDKEQILSKSAIERRYLIELIKGEYDI